MHKTFPFLKNFFVCIRHCVAVSTAIREAKLPRSLQKFSPLSSPVKIAALQKWAKHSEGSEFDAADSHRRAREVQLGDNMTTSNEGNHMTPSGTTNGSTPPHVSKRVKAKKKIKNRAGVWCAKCAAGVVRGRGAVLIQASSTRNRGRFAAHLQEMAVRLSWSCVSVFLSVFLLFIFTICRVRQVQIGRGDVTVAKHLACKIWAKLLTDDTWILHFKEREEKLLLSKSIRRLLNRFKRFSAVSSSHFHIFWSFIINNKPHKLNPPFACSCGGYGYIDWTN